MNNYKQWNKKKSSGSFRRSVLRKRNSLLEQISKSDVDNRDVATISDTSVPSTSDSRSPTIFVLNEEASIKNVTLNHTIEMGM